MTRKVRTLVVREIYINVFQEKEIEYISLTNIAAFKNPKEPKDVVKNWLRNRGTIEFIGLGEKINNPNFKGSNSTPFCSKQELIALRFLHQNKLIQPMQ